MRRSPPGSSIWCRRSVRWPGRRPHHSHRTIGSADHGCGLPLLDLPNGQACLSRANKGLVALETGDIPKRLKLLGCLLDIHGTKLPGSRTIVNQDVRHRLRSGDRRCVLRSRWDRRSRPNQVRGRRQSSAAERCQLPDRMTRRFNIAYRKAGRRGPKAAPLKLLHWERGRPNIRACPPNFPSKAEARAAEYRADAG